MKLVQLCQHCHFLLAILDHLHVHINWSIEGFFKSSWVGFEELPIQRMCSCTLLDLLENHPKYSVTVYVLRSDSRDYTRVDTLKGKQNRVETSSHNLDLAETPEKSLRSLRALAKLKVQSQQIPWFPCSYCLLLAQPPAQLSSGGPIFRLLVHHAGLLLPKPCLVRFIHLCIPE